MRNVTAVIGLKLFNASCVNKNEHAHIDIATMILTYADAVFETDLFTTYLNSIRFTKTVQTA